MTIQHLQITVDMLKLFRDYLVGIMGGRGGVGNKGGIVHQVLQRIV